MLIHFYPACADGHAPKRRKLKARPPAAVVLDIEGTVAPLTITKEVLFPYARAHLESHLKATWTTVETQSDVAQLADEVWRTAGNLIEQFKACLHLQIEMPLLTSMRLSLCGSSAYEDAASARLFVLQEHAPADACSACCSTCRAMQNQVRLILCLHDSQASQAGTPLSSRDDVQAVVQYVGKQMDADAKTTALKTLQVAGRPACIDHAAVCAICVLLPV